MTPKGLKDYVLDYLLGIDSTDFSNFDTVANQHLIKIAEMMRKKNPSLLGTLGTEDLVADQREYPLDLDIIQLARVWLKLDGDNWTKVHKITTVNDQGNLVYGDEADITNDYSNSRPELFHFRNSIFILSGTITDVTDGIKYFAVVLPDSIPDFTHDVTDLSEATDESATVKTQLPKHLHEPLAKMIAEDYRIENTLERKYQSGELEARINNIISDLDVPNLEEDFKASIPYDDGSDY